MAKDDNYFQSLFDIQSNNFNEFRHEIRADIRDVWAELKEIKEDVSDVKSDVNDVKNEVKDLKLTVTNHINSEISSGNKKSLMKAPSWMLFLFIFMLGRLSFEIVEIYQKGAQEHPTPSSQTQEFAPPSSTLVEPRKSLNKEIDKRLMKKLDGFLE
jgi:hypothetical protein